MDESARVLWVSAHPEPLSLNGSIRRTGIAAVTAQSHTVDEVDLYAMGWDPVLRREQFESDDAVLPTRFDATGEDRRAFTMGRLPGGVATERDRRRSADALVLQFPLWWYGMPAILKGWFDRVFTSGFAFGTDPRTGMRLRFENGPFSGRPALVIVTAGDRPGALTPRGISGDPIDLLFGLLHGTLAYTGFSPLPPLIVPSADFLTEADWPQVETCVHERLSGLFTDAPLRARPQFTGDYTDDWVLKNDVAPEQTGFAAHWL